MRKSLVAVAFALLGILQLSTVAVEASGNGETCKGTWEEVVIGELSFPIPGSFTCGTTCGANGTCAPGPLPLGLGFTCGCRQADGSFVFDYYWWPEGETFVSFCDAECQPDGNGGWNPSGGCVGGCPGAPECVMFERPTEDPEIKEMKCDCH